ncbi:MAG: SsrA-binding protein SmpB [Candidatus Eisenbacteria bacterium]|uniref:SsrA-binding protein n=1 Tax=Eiseniibacteriota bacterium TaxID=2212470 RepID=A0A948WDE6_UNCEI|nr:SsrA-binding protein SmpB [Candidatus Eisenbacteria bacterium]
MAKKTSKLSIAEKAGGEDKIRLIATNRKARHEYHILETLEAGIALKGPEVKSLRSGKISIGEAYGQIKDEELILLQMFISPYEQAGEFNTEPRRPRKLLLHKRQIRRWQAKTEEKGLTIVALSIYFRAGKAKIEIALARGKRLYDKREALARKDAQRDMYRLRSRRDD